MSVMSDLKTLFNWYFCGVLEKLMRNKLESNQHMNVLDIKDIYSGYIL